MSKKRSGKRELAIKENGKCACAVWCGIEVLWVIEGWRRRREVVGGTRLVRWVGGGGGWTVRGRGVAQSIGRSRQRQFGV